MKKNVEESMYHILDCEPYTPLEALQNEIGQLADEILFKEQPTIKSVLKKMRMMTQLQNIRDVETGRAATIEDVQQMFASSIYDLEKLLGIESE